MKILAIIVNHNGKKLLEKSMPSLISTYHPSLDICVVDNNSSDDSVQFLKHKYPEVQIVKSEKNLRHKFVN